jgi:endonuclease/exonuclease/phosphatase family metal-dependent hydrolase
MQYSTNPKDDKKMRRTLVTLRSAFAVAALSVAACSGTDKPAPVGHPPVADAVTIMTFNAQNLFDTADDPGKDDKAYLPIDAKQSEAHIAGCNEIPVESWRNECLYLNWNEDALQLKMAALAKTILQIGDGQGADIIAFQEVENAAVLDQLRTEHLADAGYHPAVLIEGDDLRGIDVAFLSKLPLAKPAELQHIAFEDFPDQRGDARDVLEATFVLPDGALLTGFAVHFPAPYQPTAMRVEAYEHLTALRNALPDDRYVFAAGDFNTTSGEDRSENMLEKFVRPFWTAAHELCSSCLGTYYYARDNNWSFLDMILFSPARGEKTTWTIRADSVQIANRAPGQVTGAGTPARFIPAEGTGVSDHWPLALVIESTEKQ